jgi:hypothetical protein
MAKQLPKPEFATRRGNGSTVLAGVDGRTTIARRFREISWALENDIGGDPSEAQKALIARASAIICWCEERETEFAIGAEFDIGSYGSATNAMRRLLSDLGIERVSKDVTPTLAEFVGGRQ